jgi:hypothetical protein
MPGIIDETVDGADARRDMAYRAFRELRIGHTANIGQQPAACCRRERIELVPVQIDADHPRAQGDCQARDRLSDPLRRAGNDDRFPFERHHFPHGNPSSLIDLRNSS